MRTEFFFFLCVSRLRAKNSTTNGGGPAAGARSTNSQTPHNSSLSRRPTIKILVSHHASPPKKAPSDLRAQKRKKRKKGDFALRAVAAARRRAAARVVGGALAGVLDALPVASMLHGAAATRPAVVRRIVIGRAPVGGRRALLTRSIYALWHASWHVWRAHSKFCLIFFFLPTRAACKVWQKKNFGGLFAAWLDTTLDIEFWPVNFQFLYKMGTVRKSVMVLTCSSPRTSKIEELAELPIFASSAFAHSTAYLSQKQERKAMQIFDS